MNDNQRNGDQDMNNKLIQSYVYFKDQFFYVSTINRESSSMMGTGVYSETIVWICDIDTLERGELIHQDEGRKDSIVKHMRICKTLNETGKPILDDEV